MSTRSPRPARGRRSAGRGNFDPTDIFAALNRARIKYLVIGGVAVVLYGVNRFTWDVDLCVQLTASNLDRLIGALERLGFQSRLPVSVKGLADPATRKQWTEQKGMKVYSYFERSNPPRVIDIMVKPLPRFEDVYGRRTIVKAGSISIPLVPVDVLARMKREAGRPEDLLDLRYLRELGLIQR